MKFAFHRVVVVLSIALLACSCRRSAEGETKRWDRNVAQSKEMAARYPGFADVLNAELKAADSAMADAQAVTDAKAQVKAMVAANKMLGGGTHGLLRSVDRELKDVQRAMIDAPGKAVDQGDRMAAEQALKLAQGAVAQAEAALTGGAKDAAQASVVLKQALNGLSNAESGLKRVIANAEKKVKARAAAAAPPKPRTTSTQTVRKSSTTTVPVAKPWKCKYCGSKHPASKLKCAGCGATKP